MAANSILILVAIHQILKALVFYIPKDWTPTSFTFGHKKQIWNMAFSKLDSQKLKSIRPTDNMH